MEQIRQDITEALIPFHMTSEELSHPMEHMCFFDIETTGLSPKVSSLYLIGAAYIKDSRWQFLQWFADDYTSEEEILRSFSSFLSDFDTIVHYNGSTFDLPYLEKKYASYDLPAPFSEKNSMDLYRLLRSKKNIFPVTDMKLTTMERLVNFHRQDSYSGKDCIRLYTDFMQRKYFRDPLSLEKKQLILQHNRDDLIGCILCMKLLAYRYDSPLHPNICRLSTEPAAVCLSDSLKDRVPFPLHYEQDSIRYEFEETALRVIIPLEEATLYHYFSDYKNYYYLPAEDTAIHKSVGAYVDPSFRQKATANNCYIKKSGLFLPLPRKFQWDKPTFSRTKKDRQTYLPWEENTSFTEEELKTLLLGYMKP